MPRFPKVMLAGFNRCGTRSFAHLFENAGLPLVHHKLRRPFRRTVLVGRLLYENMAAGRRPFEGFEDLCLYADLIHVAPPIYREGNRYFGAVLETYPESHVVLNTRDREDWIRSRLKHGHGEFAKRCMQALGLDSETDLANRWRADWTEQHDAVRDAQGVFPGRVHIFDIDTGKIEDLIDALPPLGLEAEGWGDTGRSRGRARSSLKRVWAHIRPRRRR